MNINNLKSMKKNKYIFEMTKRKKKNSIVYF